MRLWSLHPKYLDRIGLIACWREGLLAKAVLAGKTNGYKNHPQLIRFRETAHPIIAIQSYLSVIYHESLTRGFTFDRSKIRMNKKIKKIPITSGQIAYEWQHLLQKLHKRSPKKYREMRYIKKVLCHPSFYRTKGPIAHWEKIT